MDFKGKKVFNYVISGILTLTLLFFSFKGVKWSEFWTAVVSCSWAYVILAMAFGALASWLRGRRWRMLLLPIDPHTSSITCFNAVNISYIANMVVPRAGELVRCAIVTGDSIKGKNGKRLASYEKVLGTMVVDRVWDVITLLVLMVAILALLWGRFGSFFSEQVISKAGDNFHPVKLILIMAISAIAIWAIIMLLRRQSRLRTKVDNLLKGLGQGISSIFKMKQGWLFVIYTLGIWACYWMMSATIILAASGIEPSSLEEGLPQQLLNISRLDLTDALFLMAVGALSSLVPVPGGFGAFHYLVALALQTVYGISWSLGIIFATLSHESQVVSEIICGSASWIAENIKKKKNKT